MVMSALPTTFAKSFFLHNIFMKFSDYFLTNYVRVMVYVIASDCLSFMMLYSSMAMLQYALLSGNVAVLASA